MCACLSVVLKCWKFCWESCDNTLYVSTIFPSEKLSAQVLVYLPISMPSSLQTSRLHRYYSCACLSVGLKCRKFCWERFVNTLYVSTIFPSDKLAAQVLVCLEVGSSVGSSADARCTGTCVPISWVEVLDVLLLEELC